MAKFTINIPDEHVNDLIDFLCEEYRRKDMIDGEPNPMSKVDFAKSKLMDNIKRGFKIWKDRQLIDSVDNSIDITTS